MPECLPPGNPLAQGAMLVAGGVNFALWSPEASAVELCLFDATGTRALASHGLQPDGEGVWHGLLAGAGAGLVYGFRVHGPWAPARGLRFNPKRVLLDPCAREVVGVYRQGEPGDLSAFAGHDPADPLQPHPDDNAAVALKARVGPAFHPAPGPRHRPAPGQRVIAEVHVRNASALHPALPEALRGTYAGLAHPALIDHWRRLGVTTLQFMPLQFRADEERLQRLGLSNHWGYSTAAWFAVEPRYWSGRPGSTPAGELREALATLREAGFELLLDVVYNHSAETDEAGPTLNLRGIANRHWYRLAPQDPSRYVNWSGCGNTLNLAEPRVLAHVVDSLRYWVEVIGVDGFRFDLATALARDDTGRFTSAAGLFGALQADPVLCGLPLIAEPWDLGPDGHRGGAFPPGWLEWNDAARDALRAAWLRPGDGRASRAELARRLAGSAERFHHDQRRPRSTLSGVNFITAHDGFTLRDLVSYNERHNLANGEGNRDGHHDNLGWNAGVEGASTDPAVLALRGQLQRGLLATLLLARGTPMLLMGDEIGHSQQGNNNAYCQDNPISWLAWDRADLALCAFVARAVALRRADPALHGAAWLTGRPVGGGSADAEGAADAEAGAVTGVETGAETGAAAVPDVVWALPDGRAPTVSDWHRPAAEGLMVLLAAPGSGRQTLLLFNPGAQSCDFELPQPFGGGVWRQQLDSQVPDGDPQAPPRSAGALELPARCVHVWRQDPPAVR